MLLKTYIILYETMIYLVFHQVLLGLTRCFTRFYHDQPMFHQVFRQVTPGFSPGFSPGHRSVRQVEEAVAAVEAQRPQAVASMEVILVTEKTTEVNRYGGFW